MSITRHQAAGAYRRWEPPSFDTPAHNPAPTPEAPPRAQEPASVPPAEPPPPPPPKVHLPTVEEVEQIHDQAHKEGYDAGYEEGTARGRMEAMRLHGLLENFEQALSRIDDEVAEEILALGVEIARQMVRRELVATPENIVEVVREALQQLPQNHAMVHLHPDDAVLVRQYLGEQLAHVGNRIIEDLHITPGGCKVEASGSQIDASVETRWRRIMENLSRDNLDWTPAKP